MKRTEIGVVMAAVAAVLVWAMAAQAAEPGVNILKNADFEDGVVNPWSMWVEDQAAGVIAKMSLDKKESVKGNESLAIITDNDGGNNKRIELHQNPLWLEKGETYTYAFWAKCESTRPARMVVNHRADPWTSYGTQAIILQTDWSEHFVTFDMPANDVLAGIYVELHDNTDTTVWFDAFRLYVGDYEPDDELGGGGRAVDPSGKASATWGAIKTGR